MLVISCEWELESELDLDHIKVLITHKHINTHSVELGAKWFYMWVLGLGFCGSLHISFTSLLNNAVRKGEGKKLASSWARKSMSAANIILKKCLILSEVLCMPSSKFFCSVGQTAFVNLFIFPINFHSCCLIVA